MTTFESQIDQHEKIRKNNPALFELLFNVYINHMHPEPLDCELEKGK